jgi:hypothetical protein
MGSRIASMQYFVVMIDYGRRGREAIVDPEITKREVISRVASVSTGISASFMESPIARSRISLPRFSARRPCPTSLRPAPIFNLRKHERA